MPVPSLTQVLQTLEVAWKQTDDAERQMKQFVCDPNSMKVDVDVLQQKLATIQSELEDIRDYVATVIGNYQNN